MQSLQANAIKEDVGYPPYIKDDKKLDEHYSMVSYLLFGLIVLSRFTL